LKELGKNNEKGQDMMETAINVMERVLAKQSARAFKAMRKCTVTA